MKPIKLPNGAGRDLLTNAANLTNEERCGERDTHSLRFPHVIDRETDGAVDGPGPNLQVIISRRRSSSACTRTGDRRRDGHKRAENHKFPVFLLGGDGAEAPSCYATITNDGGDVHHREAHVRRARSLRLCVTAKARDDAVAILELIARNLPRKSMK